MFEWGPKGNCYGPQPNSVSYEDAERYFGIKSEQLAHNVLPQLPFAERTFLVRKVMTELFRQLDVNHGMNWPGATARRS
jgi:hypothetical protein